MSVRPISEPAASMPLDSTPRRFSILNPPGARPREAAGTCRPPDSWLLRKQSDAMSLHRHQHWVTFNRSASGCCRFLVSRDDNLVTLDPDFLETFDFDAGKSREITYSSREREPKSSLSWSQLREMFMRPGGEGGMVGFSMVNRGNRTELV